MTAVRGGLAGGESMTAIRGGLAGGESMTAVRGGLAGGESMTAIRGGLAGGESMTAIRGGLAGGESMTAVRGGLAGGESTIANEEPATAQPATKAIRLTFMMIAPGLLYTHRPTPVTETPVTEVWVVAQGKATPRPRSPHVLLQCMLEGKPEPLGKIILRR
jgi:hypothetical protein